MHCMWKEVYKLVCILRTKYHTIHPWYGKASSAVIMICFPTCINFLTTSLPRTWSKTTWRKESAIKWNFSLSRCQTKMEHSSRAVTDTWKYSSVVTPNHSGESRNWFSETTWRGLPAWDTSKRPESTREREFTLDTFSSITNSLAPTCLRSLVPSNSFWNWVLLTWWWSEIMYGLSLIRFTLRGRKSWL